MRKARFPRRAIAAAFCVAVLLPLAAHAAETRGAAALFSAGEYQAAIAAGEASGNAEGLTAGAGAALADATLRDAPCLPCFNRAHALASRAIAADPSRPRAYVYLTVAIGYEARIAGRLAALRAGYTQESKDAVETALTLAPNDPWVLATAGGWHIELVRAAGSLLAGLMYGARLDEGIATFKRALAADPSDATLQVNYALSLSSAAFAPMRAEIRAALAAAGQAPARDAYDAAMKARAALLLDLLDRNEDAAFLALVHRYWAIP